MWMGSTLSESTLNPAADVGVAGNARTQCANYGLASQRSPPTVRTVPCDFLIPEPTKEDV
jgi:hypothetical protein